MTPKFHRVYKSYKSYKNQKGRPETVAVFGAPVVWREAGVI